MIFTTSSSQVFLKQQKRSLIARLSCYKNYLNVYAHLNLPSCFLSQNRSNTILDSSPGTLSNEISSPHQRNIDDYNLTLR